MSTDAVDQLEPKRDDRAEHLVEVLGQAGEGEHQLTRLAAADRAAVLVEQWVWIRVISALPARDVFQLVAQPVALLVGEVQVPAEACGINDADRERDLWDGVVDIWNITPGDEPPSGVLVVLALRYGEYDPVGHLIDRDPEIDSCIPRRVKSEILSHLSPNSRLVWRGTISTFFVRNVNGWVCEDCKQVLLNII